MPLISVLLPVRNGMPHLRESVHSILGQSLRDFELLILNDGSTDDTADYCRSITDRRVRYVSLDCVGLVEALNIGLKEACSPVIARMDADDFSHPSRLERQFDLLRRESLVLLSCQFEKIDATGAVIGHASNLTSDEAIRWRLLFTPAFIHPGAMFEKRAALQVGGYQTEFRTAQDYDLWTRLAGCGRMGNHSAALLKYRVLGSSMSMRNQEQQIKNAATIASRYAAATFPGVTEDEWYQLHRFSTAGERPRASVLHLARRFAEIRHHFTVEYGNASEELNNSIAAFEQHLRWRCFEVAAGSGPRQWLESYRAAQYFDPKRARPSAVILRKLSKLAIRRSAKTGQSLGPDTTQLNDVSSDLR